MTGQAIRRGWLMCLPLVLLAVFSPLSSPAARAQSPIVDQQPQIVYENLHDGDVLKQPAFGIQLCFASPVNIKDMDKGGDFAFGITEPDGVGLGSRDVFQADGYGVTVYPASPLGGVAGQWKFHYRVTSPNAKSALEGDINYTVDAHGSPVPQETPPVCLESGGTASPLPGANTSTGGGSNNNLIYGLLAIGAAGAAVIVLILLIIRRRQGRTTQRPLPEPTTPIASSTPAPRATPPPGVEAVTPLPQPSPSPAPSTPPPGVEAVTPLPQPGPPPASVTPPPGVEAVTPLPQPGPSLTSATPPGDSAAGESARERPDNSRYAMLAIAGAVILLIGLIIRRRGDRNRNRGKPGSNDGKHG